MRALPFDFCHHAFPRGHAVPTPFAIVPCALFIAIATASTPPLIPHLLCSFSFHPAFFSKLIIFSILAAFDHSCFDFFALTLLLGSQK